ncbi:YcaO-like family protein [Archangium violaceum]|uniref:YcaO-like family protein n=1 Tax=Archangium violaceum TaxID=83451 RepID=UPI00193B8122|nr:YcaO-like family protein [Archangium violaceum]QRK07304.1 YcaO-like family protein [Archangium violaceum]
MVDDAVNQRGVACALEAAARGCPISRVDPASVDAAVPAELIDRLLAADVLPVIRDCTSDLEVPTFMVDLHDLRERHVGVYRGYGAHLDPAVALTRALTEAAQSRLVFISGSRDDHFAEDLSRLRRLDDAAALARARALPPRSVEFAALRNGSTGSLEGDLTRLLERLAAHALTQVLRVDLSTAEMPVSVVRILVPGLEGYRFDSYKPGPRARRAMERGAR